MNTKNDSPDRRGFLKGVAIGAGAYALGASLIYPQLALGQSTESYLEKIPMETRWKIASGANVNSAVTAWKYRYDKEGREQYNEGQKIRSQKAGAWMKGFANSLGLTGDNAKSMAEMWPILITLWSGPPQKYEIEEATAEKARVKCINCVYWNAMQQMKITDDLCSVGSNYLAEGLAKTLNPKMTSTLVKAKPRGDSVCEWLIELKA